MAWFVTALHTAKVAADPTAAVADLKAWAQVIERILSDFDRGPDVQVTPSYIFANIVAGYEASGIALPLTTIAQAMGINPDILRTGSGLVQGHGDTNMFYVGGASGTYQANAATDTYVVGAHFGQSTISDVDAPLGEKTNLLRFASLKSTEVSAARLGEDLVLTRKDTGETLTISGEFTFYEEAAGYFSGNVLPKYGVDTITFADGVSWDRSNMSLETAADGTHDQVIRGSSGNEVLIGGVNDTLIGGAGQITYIYDRGMGSDTIDVQNTNALVAKNDV